jgi:hypothetical protein
MCCWRRTVEVIVWEMKYYTRIKGNRNILRNRKANWICRILHRNSLLNRVIKGKIEERGEMIGRRGRRRKQLLEDLKEGDGPWKLKKEALARPLWRTRFGRGHGRVLRQTTV